jgi:hypothetical protein
MLGEMAVSFRATWGLAGGGLLVFVTIATVAIRRPGLSHSTLLLAALGLSLLALAAGLPTWNRPTQKWVAVMVDLSASTRTATYRDQQGLEHRISTLLGAVPFRINYFADGAVESAPGGDPVPDVISEKTTLPIPAGAAAVLLFSDCRFELPARIAPTYVVRDVGLEEVNDAAVKSLEIRGSEASAVISNRGKPRGLTLRGVAGGSLASIPAGSIVILRRVAPGAAFVSAEITGGDAWPENDSLTTAIPPAEKFERWWIGGAAPSADWRLMTPDDLPVDLSAYLSASVIVLDNVAASDLTDAAQQRLAQYVRDTGGGLLVLGGDHAFAGGRYSGTAIDSLSPLASAPPQPTTHWIILTDASGSMSEPAGAGATRWDDATRAVRAVLPRIPPEDLVSVGGFAQDLKWWIEGKRAKDAAQMPVPPDGIYPHGPTNLQPALEAIAAISGTLPVQVIVLSDFDAKVGGAATLGARFKNRQIRVHVLAIGEGSALKTMREVSALTGGLTMTQLDPAQWTTSMRELLAASQPNLVRHDSIHVEFSNAIAQVAALDASLWNRTWLKQGASKLAFGTAGSESIPMAAQWNIGQGKVAALAFEPDGARAQAIAEWVAQKPFDPRFKVKWEAGEKVNVSVDAIEGGKYLNEKAFSIDLLDPSVSDAAIASTPLVQTAPGRYEVSVLAPRSSRLATIRAEGHAIARFAVAGRYAPEFDAIGNDVAAMNELARRSAGRVIDPTDTRQLDIQWPPDQISLAAPTAFTGVALMLGALCVSRLR